MINRLAIIPARGGSKRIKNKNIKLFCGKPIILRTLDTVVKSKLFKKIHVSTDSSKIKRVCEKKLKIDFKRPNKFSGDKISVMSVVKYVLDRYETIGLKFDEVWLIFPCAPLVDQKDYINIKNILNKNLKRKTVLTVSEFPAPIERSYKLINEKKLKAINTKNFKKGTQEFSQSYFETGSIMAIPKLNFNKLGNKPNLDNLVPYVLERYKSVDVNNLADWQFEELIYSSVKKLKKV